MFGGLPFKAFNKARRMETRERLNDHMVTYKDWQKILDCVKVSGAKMSRGIGFFFENMRVTTKC